MMRINTFVGRLCPALILFFLLTAFGAHSAQAHDFMWWKLEEQKKEESGSMISRFSLNMPNEDSNPESLEVFVLLRPWQRKNGERFHGALEVYHQNLKSEGGSFNLEWTSMRAETINLWAKAIIDGKNFYAQAQVNAYGKDEESLDKKKQKFDEPPSWPGLVILEETKIYRVQTGKALNFLLNSPTLRPEADTIFNGTEKTSLPIKNKNNGGPFSYTPPHDKELAQASYAARKDLLLIMRLANDGSMLSFYLPLYRSYYGNSSTAGGLLTLVGGAIVAGLVMLAAKRRRA